LVPVVQPFTAESVFLQETADKAPHLELLQLLAVVVVVVGKAAAVLLVAVEVVVEQTAVGLETKLPEAHNNHLVAEALVMVFQVAWDLDQVRGVLVEVVVLRQRGHLQVEHHQRSMKP
jgi:hypothetical protein